MRTLYRQFPKTDIQLLPRILFDGKVTIINTLEEAEAALKVLSAQRVVGFDTETKPSFKRGVPNKMGLLQLSTLEEAFLFRLNKMGMTEGIADLMGNKKVLKIGLALHDDIAGMNKLLPFKAQSMVDLQQLAEELCILDRSLQKLVANLLKRKLSKRQQLSNWNAPTLTEQQVRYAATDAWVCLLLYDEMTKLKHQDYMLIEQDPEKKETTV